MFRSQILGLMPQMNKYFFVMMYCNYRQQKVFFSRMFTDYVYFKMQKIKMREF